MNFGIIAAGEGSRLANEGVSLPKPLVEIEGRPMIERLLRIFEDNEAERIVVCTNGAMPEVSEWMESFKAAPGTELIHIIRRTPSSMHTFKEISGMLRGHGRFIATTVDTIFRPEDFARYVEAWRNSPADYDALMGVTDYVEDEKPLWIRTDRATGRIEAFLDQCEPGVDLISGGIYGLSDKAVDVLDRCVERGLSRMRNYQRALVEEGLGVYAMEMGKILDIDHASDIRRAEEFLGGK